MKIIVKTRKGAYKVKVEPGSDFSFPMMQEDGTSAGKIRITTNVRTEYEPVAYGALTVGQTYSSTTPQKEVLDIWAQVKYYGDRVTSNIKKESVDVCRDSIVLKDKNKVL